MEYRCDLCGEVWDDYYDCKSHVYSKHGDDPDYCGIPHEHPEMYVRQKI